MRRTLRPLLIAALWLATVWANPAEAQRGHDGELWLRAGVRARVHARLDLDLRQMLRLDENMSHPARALTQFGLRVRLAEGVRLAVAYRYARVFDNSPDSRHRLQADAAFKGELGPLDWAYRFRYQARIRQGRPTAHTVRNRFTLAVPNDSDVTPFVSTEVFVRLADVDPVAFDTWRGTVGVQISGNDHDLDIYYRIEVPIGPGGDTGVVRHILGLAYRFTVKFDD